MFVADEFKKDLQEGASLEETLEKHDISFQDAVQLLIRQGKGKKNKLTTWDAKTGEKYIIKTITGKFMIRKSVNGKMRYFGSYETLEDAIIVRNYLVENGWYWQRIKATRKKLGV